MLAETEQITAKKAMKIMTQIEKFIAEYGDPNDEIHTVLEPAYKALKKMFIQALRQIDVKDNEIRNLKQKLYISEELRELYKYGG